MYCRLGYLEIIKTKPRKKGLEERYKKLELSIDGKKFLLCAFFLCQHLLKMYQVLTETVFDGKPDKYHTENINSLQESCHRRQSGCEGLQYSHSL